MENRWPYNKKWRFAHGYNELHQRFIVNEKYQSRICEAYHQNSYWPYGSRCLFQHFNYQKDFKWSYYSNIIKSNFLIIELSQAKKLCNYFIELIIEHKNRWDIIAENLIWTIDPSSSNHNHSAIYSRLPVFASFTLYEQELENKTCSYCLNVDQFEQMENEDFIYWKSFIKEYILPTVINVVKAYIEFSTKINKELDSEKLLLNAQTALILKLCKNLVFIYRYPIQKKDLIMFTEDFSVNEDILNLE